MRLARWSAVLVALALGAGSAAAKEIEGVDYPDTLNVGGHDLKLVGVGLRTKWFFNVYTLGAYSKSGRKSAGALVGGNEPKFIWLRMLRGIAASKMHDAIDEGFEKNVGEDKLPALKERINELKGYMPGKLKKGLDIGFTYIPGEGTIVTIGRTRKGVIAGADFAKGLFAIWFGRKPADKSLKKRVLAD
jgi:hypothetical protein